MSFDSTSLMALTNNTKSYDAIRSAADELKQVVGILLDLQGPKIRIGKFEKGKIKLVENDSFILSCSDDCIGNAERACVSYKDLYKDVKEGDELLLDDGKLKGYCNQNRKLWH